MSDDFYGDFDRDYLRDNWNGERGSDYRSVFHQDLDRMMFTPAFRRLQSKTQVFQAGEYDFYRTRLTHSLEVASIAKSIAVWLRTGHPHAAVDLDLVEAICLSHDIGHPPFGHAGERVLNRLMEKYGGFEGNAQTLRILTRTIYQGRTGMSPTRALLDGVLKYKRLYKDRGADSNHFIYDDQAPLLEFCFGATDLVTKLEGVTANDFHSLECQIMDHADDVAYSCFDLIDGFKARFITTDKLLAWAEGANLGDRERIDYALLMGVMGGGRLEPKMNHTIAEMIKRTTLVPVDNFMTRLTRRHAYALEVHPEVKSRIKLYQRICRDLVFRSGALQQIEFKGAQILQKLTGALFDNYLGIADAQGVRRHPAESILITPSVHALVRANDGEEKKARLLCDHVSGMTDAYALRSYKRLFDPDYGSISELI